MSNSQAPVRSRQDAQHSSLLRSQQERESDGLAVAGADMIAALHPQRLVGNRHLGGLTAQAGNAEGGGLADVASIAGRTSQHIQTKLMLGPANDSYEREADSVADQVVQRLSVGPTTPRSAAPGVQRMGEEEEELQMKRASTVAAFPVVQRAEEEEELQMKRASAVGATPVVQRAEEEEELQMKRASAVGAFPVVQRQSEEEEELQAKRAEPASPAGGELVPEIESEIDSARSGGAALPATVRGGMEQGFGADFGGVRVHDGPQADTLNRKLSARAFTTGSDIFFRQGAYDPQSSGGQHLLAHELTHVIHQGGAKQVQPARQTEADPFFRST